MSTVIETLFNGVSRLCGRFFGSRSLRPYEQLALSGWRDTLSQKHQHTLDEQLGAFDSMQRQAGDAKVCFFYDSRKNIPLFGNAAPAVHVADVLLASTIPNKGESIRVKMFIHEGYFFSIEFPKRPKRYFELHHMQPDKLRVSKVEMFSVLD
ncbi:hypothetical protein FRZ44_17700 [Hypericibacter terrae]|uniref:Uncharacterized protein n=1 Tax=Hypericibacter terrae TaxID=2602015 RepID=A0A5J6MNX7_9PROT|nr:hypothetical protein [Hypericibacter terrae]QEX16476.1 hypothetical protein FRZ44_17700 [Hypericibacter terrae]